jgi:hypothetical protein
MEKCLPTLSLEQRMCNAVADRIGVPRSTVTVSHYEIDRHQFKGAEVPVFRVPPQARGRAKAAGLEVAHA